MGRRRIRRSDYELAYTKPASSGDTEVTDTPQIDRAENFMYDFKRIPFGFVYADVARKIERELTETKKKLKEKQNG
jgi:hypothetical protein